MKDISSSSWFPFRRRLFKWQLGSNSIFIINTTENFATGDSIRRMDRNVSIDIR